uniref:Uncharacterized protein n=1 Tax=Solibacter usitatus (strain Ellin6076) TaxID=234267 RepID=Q01Z14_SOLUE
MATVTTGLWAVGVGLVPGAEHWWFQDGQTYGQVRWFIAHPLALAGVERRAEIVEVFELVKADGTRQVNVHVRNIGNTPLTYAIWVAQVGP